MIPGAEAGTGSFLSIAHQWKCTHPCGDVTGGVLRHISVNLLEPESSNLGVNSLFNVAEHVMMTSFEKMLSDMAFCFSDMTSLATELQPS